MNVSNTADKKTKKPKPLFGLFRKNKPEPVVVPTPLGSGISSVPLYSVLSGQDPYAPPTLIRPPKPSISDPKMPLSPQFQRRQQQQQQQQRRPRSKSTGGNTAKSFHQIRSEQEARLLTERENTLNKLCSNEITSPTSSLKESLPLLSPTYHATPPPIPPIPHYYHNKPPQSPISPMTPPPSSGGIRKFSSAHDLRKAAKLQQESIVHATDKIPIPKKQLNKRDQLSRSKSLNSSSRRTPAGRGLPKKLQLPEQKDDSDDDIPLGYLQSPISKPSSLLSDGEEEDDKDLIPIAATIVTSTTIEYQSAADKYKEKVKERLQLDDDDDDDDDDIPISLAMLSPKERTKWHNHIRG